MRTLDLRQQKTTVDELLRFARAETVRIVNADGDEFILEAADAFEREVAELGQSEKFMAFLAERSKEPGVVSLDDLERKLAQAEE
jgi:predicted ATPase